MTLAALWQLLLGKWTPEWTLACPKWFLAITCTILLHFQFRDQFSAWFFGPHLFGFCPPEVHFWTPDPKFGPGTWKFGPGWAREVFGPKMGVGKTWFCVGMVPKFEIRGDPKTHLDCMDPGFEKLARAGLGGLFTQNGVWKSMVLLGNGFQI